MIKAKLDLDRLADTDLGTLAARIQTAMTTNAAEFPNSAATVTALGTALTIFTTATQIVANGKLAQQALVDTKNTDRAAVETLLRTLCSQVNDVAKGDPNPIHDAGMDASSPNAPITYGQITGMVATPGDVAGQIHWMSDPALGALYILQTSPAQNPPVWTNQEPSKKSKGDINNLPSLTRIMVRAAAKGSHNTGAWSDPAFVIVP